MPTVQELLDKASTLLQSSNKSRHFTPVGDWLNEYEQVRHYPTSCRFFHVLVPENFEWGDTIRSVYFTDDDWQNQERGYYQTIIIHGHTRNEICWSQYQCHVLGYKPKGDEHPNFLKRWKKFGY